MFRSLSPLLPLCSGLLSLGLLCPPALAAEGAAARQGVAPLLGLQVGGALTLSPLGAAALPRLELGAELPFADRRFRAVILASWARPVAEGSATDPRVEGESWTWSLEQDELGLALAGVVRVPEISTRVVPELTLGPELFLLRSTVDGAAAAPFGEQVEQYARVGVHAALGAALALGPGELNLQLAFSTSRLDGTVTGESTTAALSPMLGYRLIF